MISISFASGSGSAATGVGGELSSCPDVTLLLMAESERSRCTLNAEDKEVDEDIWRREDRAGYSGDSERGMTTDDRPDVDGASEGAMLPAECGRAAAAAELRMR